MTKLSVQDLGGSNLIHITFTELLAPEHFFFFKDLCCLSYEGPAINHDWSVMDPDECK